MIDPHAYNITVRRREIDGELLFEASVAELPDLSGYGETYQEAIDFVLDLIEELAADAEKEGKTFPKPRSEVEGDFSGRLTLRLTRKVHRLAAEAAQRDGVSLNAYLSMAIAEHVGSESTKHEFYAAVKDALEGIAVHQRSVGSGSLSGFELARGTAMGTLTPLMFYADNRSVIIPAASVTGAASDFDTWIAGEDDLPAIPQMIAE